MNYLRSLDRCYCYNMHGSAWSGSGRPDIIGCYMGVMFCIEIKRPGEVPRAIQIYELGRWREAGALAWYATNLDQVKELMAHIEEVQFAKHKQ